MKNWFYGLVMTFMAVGMYAQGVVTGTIIDGEMNSPLPGANVVVRGTTQGVSTDFDGKFSLNVPSNSGTLVVSYLGFESQQVAYTLSGGRANVRVVLQPDAQALGEVVVVGSGIIDIVRDRQTPIAATTIPATLIQEKVGNLEFPEALKGVPSVHTVNASGYGDGYYTVRGFDQANVLIMINGQPVNDMEWGGVYWSNWSGLTDVASVVQQQRGLGSSKIGIASVGGTTNIVTKAADRSAGGMIKTTIGNDDFIKSVVSYDSGVNEDGWAVSALMSYWQGDGYMDATRGLGGTYFLSIGYKPNDKHNFNFMVTGAPQQHMQAYRETINTYEQFGYKYNSNWGWKDGDIYNFSTNYYHKPIANINWDYSISDKVSLSTVVYGSWGMGGGTHGAGTDAFRLPDDANGLIRVDDLVTVNQGGTAAGFTSITPWSGNDGRTNNWDGKYIVQNGVRAGAVLRSSVNQHNWYGLLSNLDFKLADKWTLNAGVDLRTYVGKHYRVINDLLGADGYYENTDVNSVGVFVSKETPLNPLNGAAIKNAQKVNRNFDSSVRWAGFFSQLEYSSDILSAFIQGSVSNQAYMREEFFEVPGDQAKTNWTDKWGYNGKGGVNFKFNSENNVFANAGYYSRQPFFTAIYPFSYTARANERLDVKNEGILGFEAGYAYNTQPFRAVLNAYYSNWTDRYVTFNADVAGVRQTARGYVDQVHMGVELELTARPIQDLEIYGMVSYGEWKYGGNAKDVIVYDNLNMPIAGASGDLFLDGVKVGGAPQFQTRLGAKYTILDGFSVDADWYFNDRNYAYVNATTFTTAGGEAIEMPSYSTVDAGLSYRLKFNGNFAKSLSFRANVNNLLDERYIARGFTNLAADTDPANNWKGINKANTVNFGFGRTWNFSATLRF
ncbi:MAG: TonB-dependent receptor [Capnocytophaga sp.]|nr:TonB-dependent receptor [Capnocytophaga sp.]